MFNRIGFIGGGRITRIILGGWQHAGVMPQQIAVFDRNPAAIEALQNDFPLVQAASLEESIKTEVVFAALHPPALLESLSAIRAGLDSSSLLVSLAPKVKLEHLQQQLGGFINLGRINPNAPSIIGQGFNPIAFSSHFPLEQKARLLSLLQCLGQCPEVDENLLETYAVISAMGPTYFGFQFAEVAALATTFGLTEEAGREAMRTMLHGTVDLLFSSKIPTSVALDLVPVRPLLEDEPQIRQILQQRISAMHTKLTH